MGIFCDSIFFLGQARGVKVKVSTAAEKAWEKIYASMDRELQLTGRSGYVPVHDGSEWRVLRNSLTIHPGAENCADPAKVDALRENVNNLLDAYPDTIPQLEKIGVRVRALLNRRIENFDDVLAWADSVFNYGPVTKQPTHVRETVDLAYDDIIIEVKNSEQFYVIPAAPRGEGVNRTLDFSVPGSKKNYGPRHWITRAAFAKQAPKKLPRYRGKTTDEEDRRPRGRPRIDGLTPGSVEARRADRKKEKDKAARRAAREAKREGQMASITKLRPPRRQLTRVGRRQQA